VKNVNQVANPSHYFLRQPICHGANGEVESRTWSTVVRYQLNTEREGEGGHSKSGLVCAWSAGFEPTDDALEDSPVRAGSAHATVPEEEACVGLDHPEGVATGAWSFGHSVVDVGLGEVLG
jgi:hypothetical protein